ncbi:MAG: NADH-quinone oxidoreductase subunit G [Xanthomonadales bacterium]|nr:NADH-quinone oxidoreductase subunit G [Xanthomonadales bacterium]
MSAQPVNPAVPPDHVSIEIDGKTLVVPKGTSVIQAADRAGIVIPRFCYHEKLPVAANCRMCMVEVEMGGKPMPKPQPACATPVADGMKVATQSGKALSAQRNAMEFLLINHPLDCPICDQGGECELQDLSLGFGRSVSRFAERKRVIADEDLGPLVETEMTRCIHCTRCVRVMSEVAGTYELGGMDRGERLQIGTWVGKPLMSELSGNVIDVCPVGALTDKPFRFRARPWELIARESIGYHDALGSNLWLHTRRGEVLRTVPRDHEAINECWLSDRDRYSREGLRHADRIAHPRVRRDGAWVEVDWNEAIRVAAEALRASPQGELGALVHPATTNEEGHLLARLVRALGSGHVDHRLRALDSGGNRDVPVFGMPVAAVEKADVIVLVGCNPRHEMPLLGARIRKAARQGARIHVINPIDFDFDFGFAPTGKHIVAPGEFEEAMDAAVRGAGEGAGDFERTLVADLSAAAAGVVIFGEAAQMHPHASRLRAAARELARMTQSACNEIPLGANSIGLARVGAVPDAGARDVAGMLAEAPATAILYGCEPPQDFADGRAALDALGKAGQVIAFASFTSLALEQVASVILPIALLPEMEGTLVNVDGIVQYVAPGVRPPGEARPGWRVLRALGAALALDGFEFIELAELHAAMGEDARPQRGEQPPERPLGPLEPRFATALPQNLRLIPTAGRMLPLPPHAVAASGPLRRIATTNTYGADAVLRRAAPLQAHPLAGPPALTLNPDDAAALGFAEGMPARVDGVELPVAVSPRVPRGGAWIEAGHLATATLPPGGAVLDITKA